MCTMFLIFFLGNDVVYLATSPDMSWQSLVASLNPTACRQQCNTAAWDAVPLTTLV